MTQGGFSLFTYSWGQTAFSPPTTTDWEKLIAENGKIQLPVSDMGLNGIQKGLPRDAVAYVAIQGSHGSVPAACSLAPMVRIKGI